MPKRAAQLTAASPIRARSPEAIPIRNALMKINMKSPCKLVRALLDWFGIGATWVNLEVPGRSLRLSALGLRRDPHGSVKQIHHEELEDGDKERPSGFPKILLKQTDSGIQQLHGAGERTQDQQRRRRLLVDRPQCEQSQRNCARRRVHRQ